MPAHLLQYHRFRPHWIMLLCRVLMSRLGVRWHREHLASSGGDAKPMSMEVRELSEDDDDESSLDCSTFCTGCARGLLDVPLWAACDCAGMMLALRDERARDVSVSRLAQSGCHGYAGSGSPVLNGGEEHGVSMEKWSLVGGVTAK